MDIVDALRSRISYLWRMILYTRTYLAMAAVVQAAIIAYILNGVFGAGVALHVFGTFLGVYMVNRKTDVKEDVVNLGEQDVEQVNWSFSIGIVWLVIAVISAFLRETMLLVPFTISLLLFVAYSFPILPTRFRYRRLKEVPLIKNVVVGLAWAIFLAGVPLVIDKTIFGGGWVMMFIFVFYWVFIGSIVPDIRDITGDKQAGVHTLPIILGVQGTKRFLLAATVGFILLYYWAVFANILPIEAALPGIVNLVSPLLIAYTTEENAGIMTILIELLHTFGYALLLGIAVLL